jgi:hypothetical protein
MIRSISVAALGFVYVFLALGLPTPGYSQEVREYGRPNGALRSS